MRTHPRTATGRRIVVPVPVRAVVQLPLALSTYRAPLVQGVRERDPLDEQREIAWLLAPTRAPADIEEARELHRLQTARWRAEREAGDAEADRLRDELVRRMQRLLGVAA